MGSPAASNCSISRRLFLANYVNKTTSNDPQLINAHELGRPPLLVCPIGVLENRLLEGVLAIRNYLFYYYTFRESGYSVRSRHSRESSTPTFTPNDGVLAIYLIYVSGS